MRAGQEQVIVNEESCADGEILWTEDLEGVFLQTYLALS